MLLITLVALAPSLANAMLELDSSVIISLTLATLLIVPMCAIGLFGGLLSGWFNWRVFKSLIITMATGLLAPGAVVAFEVFEVFERAQLEPPPAALVAALLGTIVLLLMAASVMCSVGRIIAAIDR